MEEASFLPVKDPFNPGKSRRSWNFSKAPLNIDIKKIILVPAKRKKGFVEYLPMNQYFTEFSTQLRDLKVVAIIPDTIMVSFAFKKP